MGTVQPDKNEGNALLEDTVSSNRRQRNIQALKGLLGTYTFVFNICVSSVSVQLLERRIPDLELNALRCAAPIIPWSIWLTIKKEPPTIPRAEIIGTCWYLLACFLDSSTYYVAASMLPLSTVQCIYQTTMIVSGLILYFLVLNERPTLPVGASALMCLVGVILVVQPDFIFR